METGGILRSSEASFASLQPSSNPLSNLDVIRNYRHFYPNFAYKNISNFVDDWPSVACHKQQNYDLHNQPTSASSNSELLQPPFNFPSSLISTANFPTHTVPGHPYHFSHSSSLTPFPLISSVSDATNSFHPHLSPSLHHNLSANSTEPPFIDHNNLLQSQQALKSVSSPSSVPTSSSSQDSVEKRPRGLKRPVPENQKDERYKMKRAKNNEAAKRSRDCKRIKEFESEKRLLEISEEISRITEEFMKVEERCQLMKMDLNRRFGVSFNNHNTYG